ncbi:hypothetical protein GCM10023221_12470 [Luteimicrobium xylanilyticum]|uniref:O-antigen ligase-related domain-containing protein n=1 Tax=Luteimicrobium xylanilyticum TaxID=1133546 RepID=A0A5P9QE00_9MICO|nr:O-antigen ligase family protein [Luteimicrobium xylanilyticum]QFU99280.1 hypothetical protein KDY119_02807 [Luteimicrobium xylanilyticum]
MTASARAKAWFTGTFAAIAILAVLAAIGVAIPRNGLYAIVGALALLVVGATVYQPVALPVLAMPALVIVQRVGGDSTNLSFSDVALFGAFWAALLLGPRPWSRPLRWLLWLSAVYQVATLFTVIANPYRANTIEWFHAWLSIAGALVVGWAVGRSGFARTGIILYLIPCFLIAVLTCGVALGQLARGDTEPVFLDWPFYMHKNFIGDVLGIAALVLYARPPWLALPRWFTFGGFWLCVAAIAGSQSRQAVVGLGVAVLVVALRRGQDVRHTKLVLLAVIPAGILVFQAFQDQLASGNQFNSAYQRLTWFQQSLVVWNQNQWFGAGLRWWYTDRTGFNFQPPQAELEVLSSAGTIGLIGFIILMVGTLVVLWRVAPQYGTLAFTVVLSRLVQGQLDLFWVSIQTSVPFVIAGVCLGALARSEAEKTARGPDEATVSPALPRGQRVPV